MQIITQFLKIHNIFQAVVWMAYKATFSGLSLYYSEIYVK